MKKLLLSLFVLVATLIPNVVSAERQIIEADGDYVLGDGETTSEAKRKSKEVAVRNASMQAAVFVESVLTVNNGMVSKDEITLVTSNVLQLQKEPEYTNIADGKSFVIRCHVVALIDTDNVEKILNNRELLRQMERDTKQIKEERDRLQKEVEYWKNLYQNATSDSEREKAAGEMKTNVEKFNATQYFERGNRFYYAGKYSKAVDDFSKAIQLDPNYADAYNNRGVAYYDLKKYDEAIRDYNYAIQFDPNNKQAYYNRGNAYDDLGKYDDAIRDYNYAILLDPNNKEAYNNRGNAYFKLKRYEEAIRNYNIAIQLDPNSRNAYYNRGNAYHDLGRYDEAIQDFNKAIQIDSNYINAYINRGVAYAFLGKYNLALADFQKTLELDPNNQNAEKALEILKNQMRQ